MTKKKKHLHCGRPEKSRYKPNLLHLLRASEGLTIAQVAKLANVSPNTVSAIECDSRQVKVEAIVRIAALFGVTAHQLAFNEILEVFGNTSCEPEADSHLDRRYQRLAESCAKNGHEGEQIVVERERAMLRGTEYEKMVTDLPSKHARAGYDILSFFPDGQEKHIEVKATAQSDPDTPFHLSASERRHMLDFVECGEYYEIQRVSGIGSEQGPQIEVITADELLHDYSFVPDSYVVSRKVVVA